MLIALGEMLRHSVDRQELALDQREQRSVVADGVRDVARFRERRHSNQWDGPFRSGRSPDPRTIPGAAGLLPESLQPARRNLEAAESAGRVKTPRLRRVLEVIGPGNAVVVQQIENCFRNRFITTRRRKGVARRKVAERVAAIR